MRTFLPFLNVIVGTLTQGSGAYNVRQPWMTSLASCTTGSEIAQAICSGANETIISRTSSDITWGELHTMNKWSTSGVPPFTLTFQAAKRSETTAGATSTSYVVGSPMTITVTEIPTSLIMEQQNQQTIVTGSTASELEVTIVSVILTNTISSVVLETTTIPEISVVTSTIHQTTLVTSTISETIEIPVAESTSSSTSPSPKPTSYTSTASSVCGPPPSRIPGRPTRENWDQITCRTSDRSPSIGSLRHVANGLMGRQHHANEGSQPCIIKQNNHKKSRCTTVYKYGDAALAVCGDHNYNQLTCSETAEWIWAISNKCAYKWESAGGVVSLVPKDENGRGFHIIAMNRKDAK